MPHNLLLYRLLPKGVTGKLFSAIDRMYAAASAVVSKWMAVSERFPIRREVAQGCPLSSLLYAVCSDSVADDLYTTPMPDTIEVGSVEWARPRKGHQYTEGLAVAAASASDLQAVIDMVRDHSQRWGWTRNVAKTSVVAFGPAASRARAHGHVADVDLFWGPTRLPRPPAEEHLGLHMHESCSWDKERSASAEKGRGSLCTWARAQRTPWLSAPPKRLWCTPGSYLAYGMAWRPGTFWGRIRR